MTVNDILDTLEDLIDSAWKIPMTNGKSAVSTDEIQNLIDDMRLALPKEIKQSKMIVKDRKDILSDAKKEAENIVDEAKKRASILVRDSEITKQAQQQAIQTLAQARTQAKELRETANKYVENMLESIETIILTSAQNFKNSHAQIKKIIKSNSSK